MFEIIKTYNMMKSLIPVKNYKKMRTNDDFLIITTKSLTILYLNETAKDFYELIDENKTVENILNELKAIYQVDFNILMNDIVNLIRDLQWKSLIFFKEIENETI